MSYTILLSFNIYFYNYKFTYYFLYWLLKILIINNIPIINDIEKPVIAIIFIQIFRFIFCDDIIREEPITIDARTKLSESFVAKSVIHRSKLVNFISSICILILLFVVICNNDVMNRLIGVMCMKDTAVEQALNLELKRQRENVELIASENYVSEEVMKVQGSILTNKYAEGYPSKRYYGGCEFVDTIEDIARDRAKQLFGAKFANVQPHSGSSANMGAYRAVLEPGAKVLGMNLSHGGHLTHGHPLNFSGKDYEFFEYGVDKETEMIDYEEVRRIALEVKPALIVAGASAYPRAIDFKKFREIADEVGAYLMVDMAHIAGLVAAGLHENPVPYAHIVTTTTHKTLRGPRGGMILTNDEEIATKLDKVVFPGIQGGPLMHVIGAKAVAFGEALTEEFNEYQSQVIKNAKVLAEELAKRGLRIVSGGTDNHLMLVDVKSTFGLTGKYA